MIAVCIPFGSPFKHSNDILNKFFKLNIRLSTRFGVHFTRRSRLLLELVGPCPSLGGVALYSMLPSIKKFESFIPCNFTHVRRLAN